METSVDTSKVTLRCQFCESWNRIDAARARDKPKCGKCGKPMLLDRPIKLDDDTFPRTINESGIPVLVDFYADWCGPCHMMAPFVDEIAAGYIGRVLVTKLNTDQSQHTAQQYQIRGLPTTIVFKDGKPVVSRSGALPRAALEEMVKAAL